LPWKGLVTAGILRPLQHAANAIAFPEPKNDRAWATRAMLGEEMWIAKRPLDWAMAFSVGATVFGLGGVWGAYTPL
jgi:hypothetical protein